MKSVKNEFPNPVLSNGRDDYIAECYFNTLFNENEIRVTDENIEIPISYTLNCKGLNKLIEEEKAVALINVKSSAASFSRVFKFFKGTTAMTIQIPKFSVSKSIDIQGCIVANTAINHFSCPGEFNNLYFENASFEIRRGDVLARDDVRSIYIDDSELEKPISSIFQINCVPNQNDGVIAEFHDEKIKINLTEPLYKLYYDFRDFNNGSLRRYITGIIVYPVLIEAIAKICEGYQGVGDDYSEKRWFRTIEHKAEKIDISLENYIDSYTTLADRLLGNISTDALCSFRETLESEINNGETQMIGGVD